MSLYNDLNSVLTPYANKIKQNEANVRLALSLEGGGAPIVVASTSAMTDTSKIYVLSSDGNWYYHNGSSWVAGGEYGAVSTDTTLTQSGKPADAKAVGDRLAAIDAAKYDRSAVDTLLGEKVSTINGISPDETGNVEVDSGGLSATAAGLLLAILEEGVYGTDQSGNISLLRKELYNVTPVSISATLNGRALVGMNYSELTFTVIATFDDDSTSEVQSYRVTTAGAVKSGSNTVTIKYRGLTTTATFTAENVTTYTITYNLTDVTSSNVVSVVDAGTRYATELSVDSDHSLGAHSITMGGVDITNTVYNGGNIVIDSVTGNVVITAVGIAYTYLDDLIQLRQYTNEGDPTTRLYSDNYLTSARNNINYLHVGKATEYPALNDCTLIWTITNTSDTDATLDGLGLGLISGNEEQYVKNNAVAYWQATTNYTGVLASGESISGTYSMRKDWQLIWTVTTRNIEQLDIRIRGDYIAKTFSSYDEVFTFDANTPIDGGSYRTITFLSANGDTLTVGGGNLYTIGDGFAAGEYDVAFRTVWKTDGGSGNINTFIGFVDAPKTATTINNAYAGKRGIYRGTNVWATGRLVADSNGSYLVGKQRPDKADGTYYMEIRVKEATT